MECAGADAVPVQIGELLKSSTKNSLSMIGAQLAAGNWSVTTAEAKRVVTGSVAVR